MEGGISPDLDRRVSGDLTALDEFARELSQLRHATVAELSSSDGCELAASNGAADSSSLRRLNADPATVEQGLAKLVLSLVELLRQLLEKQALRRIEAGSVTDDEIERMGVTFLSLERKMEELRATFGLEEADLSLNLGSLGELMQEA